MAGTSSITEADKDFTECLHPDTRVSLVSGEWKLASEVVVGDSVWGWDGMREQLVAASVTGASAQPIAPTITVTTARGRVLTVTREHPFRVADVGRERNRRMSAKDERWVAAADLTSEHRVRVGLDMPTKSDSSERGGLHDEGWLIGYLIGNGHLREKGCSVSIGDDASASRVAELCELFDIGLTRESEYGFRLLGNGYKSKNHVRTLLYRYGLQDMPLARAKRVPQEIFRGGLDAWVGFLNGYFDADGSVKSPDQSGPIAAITSFSNDLVLGVQELLARLNVQSSLNQIHGVLDGKPWTGWQVGVTTRAEIIAVAHHLDDVAHSVKAERLAQWRVADVVQSLNPFLHEFDRVETIEPGPVIATIGLTIAGVHSHVTNGLVTHNTWENISPSGNAVIKLDARGIERQELITGRRNFMITTEERLITQDRIVAPNMDPFLNGCFRPVVVPDSVDMKTNPNALSDDEIRSIFASSDIAFGEWMKVLDSQETLHRMVDLADASDISLKRYKALTNRLADVKPRTQIVQKDREEYEKIGAQPAPRARQRGGMSADYRS